MEIKRSKLFMYNFTENKYTFLILWKSRKLRSLFQLKDKVDTNIVVMLPMREHVLVDLITL